MAPERPRPSSPWRARNVSIASVGALLALFAVAILSPWSANAGRDSGALEPSPSESAGADADGDANPTLVSAAATGQHRERGEITPTGPASRAAHDAREPAVGALAAGTVSAALHVVLNGARVEVMDIPDFGGSGSISQAELAGRLPFAARASGLVRGDSTFTVPAPSRPVQPYLRLRVVLADGQVYDQGWTSPAFTHDIMLRIDGAVRSATGRLHFRGASAAGLATLRAACGGALVGRCELASDGQFTLRELPCEPFEVIVVSARPAGELARFQLATLTGDRDAMQLDLGTLEVEGMASILELEVVDPEGEASDARLVWRGRGGAGSALLRAAPVHTFLMHAAVEYALELERAPLTKPVPLTSTRGRVRIVLGP